MSTRRLAASSRKNLEALRYQGIAATDGYAQIQAIAASLSPEHALLFAEPMHDASAGTTDWYTSAAGDIRPFSALSPAEQEWTRSRTAELAGGINALAEQLKNSNEGPKVIRGNVLALALRFPNASHIYLVGSQPVVTCWGFVPAQAGVAPEDMVRAGAVRPAPAQVAAPAPTPEPEAENAPAVIPVATAATGFAWWKALLYILLGLLLLAGLLFAAFILLGPSGCAPENLQKYAPGCAEKKPETANVQVPPKILAALNDERKQEDDLRKEVELLRSKLIDRAALCVRETPKPPVEEPKPEPVVETPPAPEPQSEEPPMMADLLPGTPEPQEEPPLVAELLPSTPEPPKEEPKPQPKPEPKPKPEPQPTPEPQPEPKAEPKPVAKPRKGDPLVIPEDARKNNDLSFLEGCWESDAGLFSSTTAEPINIRYCFDKNGRGTQEVEQERNGRCVGPIRARFDSSGKLRMDVDRASCTRGGGYVPQLVECTRGNDGKADCDGKERGGPRTWKNPFRRSE